MKNCKTCKYWIKIKDSDYYQDMGDCKKLSGNKETEEEEYPNVNETGIESTPLCHHDGIGIEYETKSWFGCIHHKDK